MALSIRWKILLWISANWRTELHFPKFTNSRGAFHSIEIKFRRQFLEISMGEWYRLFQREKRQDEQLCSLGIFQWFLDLNRKQNTDMWTSWLFIHHNSIDLIQSTTAAKRLFINCRKTKPGFNESYNGSARVINLCTYPSQPTQNKQAHYGGHYFFISLSSRI